MFLQQVFRAVDNRINKADNLILTNTVAINVQPCRPCGSFWNMPFATAAHKRGDDLHLCNLGDEDCIPRLRCDGRTNPRGLPVP